MMTDPIADMIARIRNAMLASRHTVNFPKSKVKLAIVRILKEEGFIDDFSEAAVEERPHLVLKLRMLPDKRYVISKLRRESKPGGRQYVRADKIQQVASGFGAVILSTPQGVMTGERAREKGIGGEVLMTIW